MQSTMFSEVDHCTLRQARVYPLAAGASLIGFETEDELLPYVLRVLRHRKRRAVPGCADIAEVTRVARQITRTIMRKGYRLDD